MTIVNIYEAKAQLSALVSQAERGEEVVIARAGRPLVRLVPIAAPLATRSPGALKGRIAFFDETEIDAEIQQLFEGVEE
ncbi:MAG: type II toxin-antitoxin system prevent-host-death family antitoxin [Actinomycetia bacterium]|jgi:prevent-host-death family protein|nr:type II toxin-antitoxin system prevent-host-death family antitoxin [Actinomycetes bacterium]MCH9737971.1 type II toxin-antitoxin system prevent-host-death family antitoxin [Actinomycetes bacterium]